MTTAVLVVLMILACGCVALGVREVVRFRRWIRHIRRAESEYIARIDRSRPARA